MPHTLPVRLAAAAGLLVASCFSAYACTDAARGIGVERIVEVDATDGPVFGFITKQQHEARFLGPKEAVLTFDDGPLPGVTRAILDILDQFCTKATFFSVGRMAVAYPDSVRDILARGHTLGTHTWSHPMSLPRLSAQQARDQIESGFAAVSLAAGQPIAPFFRFPGLNDSAPLVQHLAGRNIATFTVDVVSNDSYIHDPQRLIERTLAQLEAQQGGIMLFHDIKHQTARALPTILAEMKRRGYKIVHLTSKHAFKPDERYMASVAQHVAAKKLGPQRPPLVAIVETPAAPSPDAAREAPVVAAAPPVPGPPIAVPASPPQAPVARKAPPKSVPVEVVAGVYPNRPALKPKAVEPAPASVRPVTTGVPPPSSHRPPPVQQTWQEQYRLKQENGGS